MRHAETAPRTALLGWVAAFVVHRVAVVLFGFDGVFFWEEAHRLLMAEALLEGWNLPLPDVQADPYAGGSLLFAYLLAAVSVVAPASLVTLKCVALAWNAFGLWLWLLATDFAFGRRAAHALGLVWLAAPPVFVVFNVVALGSHSDSITIIGLQFLLMLRYLATPTSTGLLLAWMAAAGFGVWFTYSAALPFVVITGYALAAGALPPKRWGTAVAGFVVGFSPWIAHYLATGGSTEILRQTFLEVESPGYLVKLYDVTVRGAPVALYFRDIGIPGDVKVGRAMLAYPYLAIYTACWLALVLAALRSRAQAVRERLARRPELAALAIFPSYLLAIAASNQEFNDYGIARYITLRVLVPALCSVLFAIALAAARAPRPIGVSTLAACVLLGLVGTVQLLSGSGSLAERNAEARLIGAEASGALLVIKHGDSDVFGERIAAMPEELRARAWRGVGSNITYRYTRQLVAAPASRLTESLLRCDAAYRADCIEGARLMTTVGPFQVAPLRESPRRTELVAAIDAAERGASAGH